MDRSIVGILLVATLAAATTAVAGFVLADVYRPDEQGSAWRELHLVAGVAFLVTSAVAAVLALLRRRAFVAVCALAATATAAVTLLTRSLVAWDLVGLREVTVQSDVSGYWTPALDDEVVLVIVGTTEASPGQYGIALLAHLGAPVLGAAALFVGTLVAMRSLRRAPRHDAVVAAVAA